MSEIRYQRPATLHPWASKAQGSSNGSVWIKMKPRKILDQFSKGAGTIAVEDLDTEFVFLAPLVLNENIVHHWEAYESVASRLAQKVRSAAKLGSEIRAMTDIFGKKANAADVVKDTFSKSGSNEGRALESYVKDVYSAVPSSRITPIKVDTPLYYTNSDRRQIVFEFQLFYEKISKNPEDSLIKPIKELMKYSSPDLKGELNIQFPYMWDIRTSPNEFLHYKTCALTSVQPTWNSPYIDGTPSSVNLLLSFTDMSPLYAGTIEKGSIINVITSERTRERQARGQLTANSWSRLPSTPVLKASASR
jgi:hypothetical protein